MAHFRIELPTHAIEYKKTESLNVEQLLCNLSQNPDVAADSKFFVKDKPVTLAQMHDAIESIKAGWLERKERTHKQISVIDGVSGLKRKKIWVRK